MAGVSTVSRVGRMSQEDEELAESSAAGAARGDNNRQNTARSSFELMGCVTPSMGTNQSTNVPGVGATLSRPPSSMPDFTFAADFTLSAEEVTEVPQVVEQETKDDGKRPYVQFILSMFFFVISLMAMTGTGSVITVLKQTSQAVPGGYVVILIFSIATFVFSVAALGCILYGIPRVRISIPRSLQTWTWPRIRWPQFRSLIPGIRRPAQQRAAPDNLPEPKQFELEELGGGHRPPTPYPGPLPLGFPSPPSAVARMGSVVSRLTTTSFRSEPRTVSPLSDMPPTPPPKDPGFSRLQSREPLIPPTASGESVAQSDTRASILTTLCDAVQLSSPDPEPDRAAQNYSPLGMASSSPAAGTSSRSSATIQSPKPTYPIELASPSRGREHDDESQ